MPKCFSLLRGKCCLYWNEAMPFVLFISQLSVDLSSNVTEVYAIQIQIFLIYINFFLHISFFFSFAKIPERQISKEAELCQGAFIRSALITFFSSHGWLLTSQLKLVRKLIIFPVIKQRFCIKGP